LWGQGRRESVAEDYVAPIDEQARLPRLGAVIIGVGLIVLFGWLVPYVTFVVK